MITEAFNTKFHTLTPDGKINFIGIVLRYFDINTKDCIDGTKDTYIRDYNERIFPMISPGRSVEEYDDNYINNLLYAIKNKYNYDEVTIASRYRHLITDPFEAYYKDLSATGITDNPFWGAGYKFNPDPSDAIEASLLKIPKSLSIEQELKASAWLLEPNTAEGRKIGVASMLCCGARNNEAAGFDFGDLSGLTDYPECHVLRLVRTSVLGSNKRKGAGKTWNAPRRLSLPKFFSDFLIARKEYLNSIISFPYKDKYGKVYSTVDDLPIACRGSDYFTPCSADDLTRLGRILLRDILHMREQSVSGISYMLQHSDQRIPEKDPTTYLLRRNFATHLYTLGFPIEWCQYYMGHLIEDNVLKRSDFNDDGFLYEMALLLDKHPLNKHHYSPKSLFISETDSRYQYITIANRELNDPISITINCSDCDAEIISTGTHQKLPREIDITKQINT